MASHSETGFGAKIRKAQDLLLAINSFPVYEPPRAEESLAAMTTLIDEINQLNADETTFKEQYRIAVDDRQRSFRDHPGSVERLLSPVVNAVKAQYGNDAKQTLLVKELIRKMRSQPSSKPQGTDTKSVSKAESSFGSMTKTFNDLLLTLMQFADYNPSNPDISIPVLQQKVLDLTTLNDAVMATSLLLKSTKKDRIAKYAILEERIARIKSYIKAQYGNDSPQFDAIRTLRL